MEYLLQHVCGAVANVQVRLFVDLEIFILVHELLCVFGGGVEMPFSMKRTGKSHNTKVVPGALAFQRRLTKGLHATLAPARTSR